MITSTRPETPGTPSMLKGLRMAPSPRTGPGEKASATAPTTTATTTIHAKGRQRGVGGRPSGNSNPRSAKRPTCGTQSQETIQAIVSPPGSDPWPRHKRVGGVLAAEQEHPREETDGAEEPADVVVGREAGRYHGSDRREAYRYHDLLDALLEDGDAGMPPAQRQHEEAERRERQGYGAHGPGDCGGHQPRQRASRKPCSRLREPGRSHPEPLPD